LRRAKKLWGIWVGSDARVGEGAGILSLENRLGLGARICIDNILDTEWGQNLFMYSIYVALKMSLEKTIETYKK
jgi:hypothetical protein